MPIIQAVDRALRILDLFDEQWSEIKITEISERMGLHKSTVHSLLKTLQLHGYISQNAENGKYRLGLKLLERGHSVVYGLDIRKIAKPYLFDLSMKTGQTTHLVVLDGREGVYIDKVEGPLAVILYSRIGRRIPIHCSAVGKVLVSFKPKHEQKKILEHYVFAPQTENTITNKKDFLNELQCVSQAGYALDNEENEPGVRCIAVPVRDHTGHVVAAISMSTLISRVDDEKLKDLIDLLKQTSSDMSSQMGFGILSTHSP